MCIRDSSMAFDYKALGKKFDLIFLDPPFHENLIFKSLEIISQFELLNDEGLIYVECEKDLNLDSLMFSFSKLKESQGGETKYYLYES